MNVEKRSHAGFTSRRKVLVAAVAGVLAATTLTASYAGPAQALTGPSPGTLAGRGFDACDAPAQATMTAWHASSPYSAVGIYIGGNNRACQAQPNLTATWVNNQRTAGWHLLPIYLGPQPFCTTSTKPNRFHNITEATSQARVAADDAVAKAQALGLASGSTLFNDIENYNTAGSTGAACLKAVLTYQSVWTARLHDRGFMSGFYSSLGSGVRDQVAVYNSTTYVRPDYLWFARYDGIATVSNAAIPGTFWLHRRIKQYQSPVQTGSSESYGGKTLSVDRNQVDVRPLPATRVGDFNRNGWSDLLARQVSTGSLYLYPGNGTKLGSRVQIARGLGGLDAITRFGDFNRDGNEDLIAREKATGTLWLYPGTRTGLAARVRIGSSGWNAMREITPAGDLDGDGFPDLLAVRTSTGRMYLYPGRGTSLGTPRLVGGGWNAMSELTGVGDFNGDGRVDMVARHSGTGDLWLYPGNGVAFGARVRIGTGGNSLRDLVGVGDFDRDGFTDLIAVRSATGELLRYPGRGTSLGTPLVIGSTFSTNYRPLL
jgi:hypothetical protein